MSTPKRSGPDSLTAADELDLVNEFDGSFAFESRVAEKVDDNHKRNSFIADQSGEIDFKYKTRGAAWKDERNKKQPSHLRSSYILDVSLSIIYS